MIQSEGRPLFVFNLAPSLINLVWNFCNNICEASIVILAYLKHVFSNLETRGEFSHSLAAD